MGAPGLLLTAPHSGAGKTTAALVLAAAFRARGLSVQGFKVGPDYIDPTHLTEVTGRPVYNLDGYFLGEGGVRWLYQSRSKNADLALVEGVMGLFDGKDPLGKEGSAAQVAKALGLPVVLVVDAGAMAGSIAALARGFRDHDPELAFAGVIANRVAGPGHAEVLRAALMAAGIPFLGYLPKDPGLHIPERHLGLVLAGEAGPTKEALLKAAATLDLEGLLAAAQRAKTLPPAPPPYDPERRYAGARIAYARDAAFRFYYPEVLETLGALGAELIPFSPVSDPRLPEGVNLVWLGGGYPELLAPALSENRAMRRAIRDFPGLIFAECGGYMYLAEAVVYEGRRYPMAGRIPGEARVEARPVLGYREVEARAATPLFPAGEKIRGHEFHYARMAEAGPPLWADGTGYGDGRVHASFVHLYLLSNPAVLYRFLEGSGGRLAGSAA